MARDLVRDLREHKKMSDADRHRAYILAIKQARDKWSSLMMHGTSDLMWPDGSGINLVRNHIISYACDIKREYGEDYGYMIPPEVSNFLMVPGDEWFDMRMKALNGDPSYKGRLIVADAYQMNLF